MLQTAFFLPINQKNTLFQNLLEYSYNTNIMNYDFIKLLCFSLSIVCNVLLVISLTEWFGTVGRNIPKKWYGPKIMKKYNCSQNYLNIFLTVTISYKK